MAKGIRFQGQIANPFPSSTDTGLWVDSTDGSLQYETGTGSLDVSGSIEDLVSGVGILNLAKNYLNTSGVTILNNVPVCSLAPGAIALASGSTLAKAKFIGITLETIAPGSSGKVAIAGIVPSFSGHTHASFIYLGTTDGTVTETPTTTTGFYIVRIGLMEGTNLILRPHHIGRA